MAKSRKQFQMSTSGQQQANCSVRTTECRSGILSTQKLSTQQHLLPQNVGELQKHCAELKKPDTRLQAVGFYLMKFCKSQNIVVIESRLVVSGMRGGPRKSSARALGNSGGQGNGLHAIVAVVYNCIRW